MEKKDCDKALCYRVVATRGEVIEKGHSKDDAIYGKNAFAKVRNLNILSSYSLDKINYCIAFNKQKQSR